MLDNSLELATLVHNDRFSVRVAPPSSNTPRNASNILTTFVWRDPGVRVLLAGSFDDWRKHEMTFVPDVRYHILVTELPPGEYVYRFVVDGRWKVDDADPNLCEDEFGELSHFLTISHDAVKQAAPKRFSTAAVAHTDVHGETAVEEGESDTESEISEEAPLPPRHRGDGYIEDYDDDACGELDLQADVFEAMKDVAETTTVQPETHTQSQSSHTEKRKRKLFKKPGARMLRKVWGMLFGEVEEENIDPKEKRMTMSPTHNHKLHGLANANGGRGGLKIWFPNEKNFPLKSSKGRKIAPEETKDVIDVGEKALKLHQVEENANTRQMLGKTLFAQGKYDASLALFSLSVKLREDNGLKYAKTTAIAHTDVASAFIHLEDLKNAEKHLRMALAIFEKSTFSGGRAQLGDVHCFLGVVGDMKGDLKNAERSYRTAISTYEGSKATSDNPNYATAKENLKANIQRQKYAPRQRAQIVDPHPQPPPSSRKAEPSMHTTSKAPTRQQHHKPQRRIERSPPPQAPPPQRTQPARPLEPSRPAPQISIESRSPPPAPRQEKPTAVLGDTQSGVSVGRTEPEEPKRDSWRKSSRPKTWKDLADTARASMPQSPPQEEPSGSDDEVEPAAGSYEEMSRTWHKDARKLMAKGQYKEAIDLYTLAVYTRKRHGPWSTRENAETLVEHARALFATKQLTESVDALKDAVAILENLDNTKNSVFLGEVWSNLGSVLDRVGNHQHEALTAHCAGMVAYGRAGMSTKDTKWLKAWKSLCINLKMSGSSDRTDEIWRSIDLQIRGVAPLTKVASVILHG